MRIASIDSFAEPTAMRGRSNLSGGFGGFGRFPTWMWRNAEVLDFVGWLREYNDARVGPAKAGFYGLDLYSMYASIDAIVTYLDRIDPIAAARAPALRLPNSL